LKATFAQLRSAGFELFQDLPVVWVSLDVFFTGVGCLDMPGVTLSTVQQNNQLTCPQSRANGQRLLSLANAKVLMSCSYVGGRM
jgi:hypothetical protein